MSYGPPPQPPEVPDSSSPYGGAEPEPAAYDEARRAATRRRVFAPAIGLLIVAILGVLVSGGSLVANTIMGDKILADLGSMPDEQKKIFEVMYGPAAVVIHGWGLLASLAGLAGATMLLKGKGRTLGIVGAFALMTVPACCCCVAGMGVGVWALIVLFQADVIEAFADR